MPTQEKEIVYRALDIEGEQAVPERVDNAGTRHRAAYRLTRGYPECVVTVVSQDGSVRYVGNRNGKVTYWDILSTNDFLFQTHSSRLTSSGGTRDDPFGPEEFHDHRKQNRG
jgi:hypothetical protein